LRYITGKGKRKVAPVHTTEAYEYANMAPLILNLCNMWRWVVCLLHAPATLLSRKELPCTYWTGGSVGPI